MLICAIIEVEVGSLPLKGLEPKTHIMQEGGVEMQQETDMNMYEYEILYNKALAAFRIGVLCGAIVVGFTVLIPVLWIKIMPKGVLEVVSWLMLGLCVVCIVKCITAIKYKLRSVELMHKIMGDIKQRRI